MRFSWNFYNVIHPFFIWLKNISKMFHTCKFPALPSATPVRVWFLYYMKASTHTSDASINPLKHTGKLLLYSGMIKYILK